MINLLSTDHKAELRAARVNVFLSRYIGIVLLALIFMMGVLYVSYTVLEQTKASAEERISSNDLKADVYRDTKEQSDLLSSKLADAKAIIQQEKSFSTLLTALGQAMPADTVLDSLKLDAGTLSGVPTELVAYAKTEESGLTIQQNLQSSGLFVQVALKGTESTGGPAGYPVKITLTTTFNGGAI